MKKRSLRGATVVITGASSGIGRAAALTFARHGARLVLAARRAEVLTEVAAECQRLGAAALPVPTDVTDAQAVAQLAEAAAAFGGQIDVWINNVGTGAVGEFDKTPLAAHEQVLRVNILGNLYGAYAVLPYFKRQQHGILIFMNSLGGWVPMPYSVAYSTSKFGLRGMAEALRTELLDSPDIHVCSVYPAFVDAPGFQHGANYSGKVVKPAPPIFAPQQVADTLVALAQRPRPSVMVGWSGRVMRVLRAVAPNVTQWSMLRFFKLAQRNADPAPVSEGSIFAPSPPPTAPKLRAATVATRIQQVVEHGWARRLQQAWRLAFMPGNVTSIQRLL
ncbi:SDR family oxidoreductase [Hymenobacter qilianensis]|uniref:SDR family oxidoreductase n=1 Tax=Hymenobacter qilianensis TaxID=1385715 RepID=A0A7H0GSG3_9BACT|nr:SDR family oxidoreductase [Hymenobacter qilianensis]QNP51229.1 SDR family oxidoreductase [Hymenobacter qilianensis]